YRLTRRVPPRSRVACPLLTWGVALPPEPYNRDHAMRSVSVLFVLLAASVPAAAQRPPLDTIYTHADTLRGSNGPARAWWDASFYDLHVRVNPADSSVRGWNGITYKVLKPAQEMQIDLQTPLEVDSIVQDGKVLTHRRDGNALFVALS